MTTLVYLVRHATHDRVGRILCGRMPGVTLGAEGRAEAERLASRLAGERIAAVLTSPLERARETAEIVARRLGLEATVDEDLNEIDFGAWSGKTFDELEPDPAWRRWNAERGSAWPPGGETMAAAEARIVACIERARDAHPDGGAVLVSHGDVIKAGVMRVLGLPLDAYARFDIDPASVSVLALWPEGGKVLSLNERLAA